MIVCTSACMYMYVRIRFPFRLFKNCVRTPINLWDDLDARSFEFWFTVSWQPYSILNVNYVFLYIFLYNIYVHIWKRKLKLKLKLWHLIRIHKARTAKPIAIIHESKIYLFEFMYDSIFRQTVHADRRTEVYVNIYT